MKTKSRQAVTLFELLVVLALFAIFLALMFPALAKMREAAVRAQSVNNLKQIALAVHIYHDANGKLPSGVDANGFSAAAHLLPFVEQESLYKQIQFDRSIDDKVNAQWRRQRVEVFLSPLDGVRSVSMDYGATNYLFCAGSKPALEDNNGTFYKDSEVSFADVTDGLSNTIMAGETAKGDSGIRAMTVLRQHVQLKKEDLAKLKPETGVAEFKADKHIAADRCASWMDGSFLQGTFTTTRTVNDPRPDVNCGGIGGYSGLRSATGATPAALADGSVRTIAPKASMRVWKSLGTRNGGETLPGDF